MRPRTKAGPSPRGGLRHPATVLRQAWVVRMSMREAIAAAQRVVVKVGSSSLATAAGGIDLGRIRALVDILASTSLAGRELVLVSSGAIAAGLAPLALRARPQDLATQQAAASVGQGLLMGHYTRLFGHHGLGVGQVLLTVDDVTRRGHYRNAYRTFGWPHWSRTWSTLTP